MERTRVLGFWYDPSIQTSARKVDHQDMKRTVVWLTNEQIKTLTEMSESSLAPISALVRRAVEEYLEKHSPSKNAAKRRR